MNAARWLGYIAWADIVDERNAPARDRARARGREAVRRSTARSIPFVKFGGLKFLEAAHVKDLPRRPALGGEPARPRRRSSRPQADPRYRTGNGTPDSPGFRAERPRLLDAGVLPASRGSRRDDAGSRRRHEAAGEVKHLGGTDRAAAGIGTIQFSTWSTTIPARAAATAGAHGSAASLTAELPHRSHARSAGSVWR